MMGKFNLYISMICVVGTVGAILTGDNGLAITNGILAVVNYVLYKEFGE